MDLRRERVVKGIDLRAGAMPQDVKLSPDGRTFYVADMASNGVWLIDAHRMRKERFQRTGRGAHGLYPSRDSRYLYVSNRGAGTITLISFRTRRPVRTWRIPGGGSPDMGGVSADGRVLWLSGRYNSEVYAISTSTGRLLHRIPVGHGPARPVRLAPARPLLDRAHGDPALAAHSAEPIADAVGGLDRGVRGDLVQLAPQARHVLVEGVVLHHRALGPRRADQVTPAHDRARARGQRREDAGTPSA